MFSRIISQKIEKLATKYPVVTIMGPRQAGKTYLVNKIFPEYSYFNLDDINILEDAKKNPVAFLEEQNSKKIILDEIQELPILMRQIKVIVDKDPEYSFILTGSQQLLMNKNITQSLAGRTAIINLLPLTYQELYQSNTEPSLSEIILNGFYPGVHKNKQDPENWYRFYQNTYLEKDITGILNIRKMKKFQSFLILLATQVGQVFKADSIAQQLGNISLNTIQDWVSILEQTYVIFQLRPYFKRIRKTQIKSPKLYFYDTGLLCYLLKIKEASEVKKHKLWGNIFENFVVADFKKKEANKLERDSLSFYRDTNGNEVDLLLAKNGTIYPMEIKASPNFHIQKDLKGLRSYNKAHNNEFEAFVINTGNVNLAIQDKSVTTTIIPYKELKEFHS